MTDIARARDALHALLKLKTINKDARYYAETALSHLQDEPPSITLDRRTPDSPYELPPGRDPITCPKCGRTSYHPVDIEKKYCGACHEFHEDMPAKDTFKRDGWDFRPIMESGPDPFDDGGKSHSLKDDK